MGIGTNANFVIYEQQFWSGVVEVLQRETGVFNENSAGALQMTGRFIKGNFEESSFLQYTGSLVTRRDVSTMGAVADINVNMGQHVGVKCNRRVGPVAMNRDAYRKAGLDPKVFSLQIGEQVAPEIMADYCDSIIAAVSAGIQGVGTALTYDATADALKTLNHGIVPKAMAKFGDRASRLIAFVMHSKPYFDLVGQAVSDKVINVADVVIYGGNVATFGKPVIVTDSPSLTVTDASGNITAYNTLLLTNGAAVLTESEERDVETLQVLGFENLATRLQAEHAFNLDVKGCAWDIVNGGKNPSNAALALATNWDKVANDNKSLPGVLIKTQ